MRRLSIAMALASLLASTPAPAGTIHDGRESIPAQDLRPIVERVIRSLPGIPHPALYADLIMETAAAESRLGRYAIKARSKGSLGMMQIQLSSADDTAGWLRAVHPERHAALMRWADEDLSMRQNLEYCVEFGIAMAANIYLRMCPRADLTTRAKRSRVWKAFYNSSLGAGSEEGFVKAAAECLDADGK